MLIPAQWGRARCGQVPVIALYLGHLATHGGHNLPYQASPCVCPGQSHDLGPCGAVQRWASECSGILPAALRRQNELTPPRKLSMDRIICGDLPPYPLPNSRPDGKLGGGNDGVERKAVVVSGVSWTVCRKAAIWR